MKAGLPRQDNCQRQARAEYTGWRGSSAVKRAGGQEVALQSRGQEDTDLVPRITQRPTVTCNSSSSGLCTFFWLPQ